MAIDLDGAVAVITGAGSGIGRATAHSLARRGSRIVVTDRDEARAATVAAELGEAAVAVRCDVTITEDLEATRAVALDRFGRVDLVMNNVGKLEVGRVEDIPLEAWQRSLDIILLGIVRSNLVFLPGLLAQGSGHIVNVASAAGLLPYGTDRLPYTAAKHAVVGLTGGLALDLRPRGIGVTLLCPLGVATNVMEQMTLHGTPQTARRPAFMRGVADAADVGELVAEAVAADRYLVVTDDVLLDEVRALAADPDAYLVDYARRMEESA